MKVNDIRTFIPSKNFEHSQAFYTDFGFVGEAVTNDLMIFENGECAFFLQQFYSKEFAENLMFQLCVEDIEAAYSSAKDARYIQKIKGIEEESWGRVFYLWGPSGELWHVTQLHT